MLVPMASRSTHGELHQAQAGNAMPASRIDASVATASPPPALSPAIAICRGLKPCESKKPYPEREYFQRRRKRMLRREPIAKCERASLRLPSSLGDHVAVAVERSGDIATAMQKQDRGAGFACGVLVHSAATPFASTAPTRTSAGNGYCPPSASRRLRRSLSSVGRG